MTGDWEVSKMRFSWRREQQEGCGWVRIWRKSIPKRRTVMLMTFGGDKQEEGTCDGETEDPGQTGDETGKGGAAPPKEASGGL